MLVKLKLASSISCKQTAHTLKSLYNPRIPGGTAQAAHLSEFVEPSTAMTALISFDVDGTLIHSVGDHANRLHKECFAKSWKNVFGLDTHIDVIAHHGSTDPLILVRVLEHHGISKTEAMSKLPELKDAMLSHFRQHEHRAGDGIELLPGVEDILKALKERDDVIICLVTGNLEPIGWKKMDSLGIKHYFTLPLFGGFGSDFCSGNHQESWKDRAELVRIAARKAAEITNGSPIVAHYHVGDTPMDIQAAAAGGAKAIGVLTGVYSRQQLESVAVDGDIVLPDLKDGTQFLKAVNLA